MSVMYEQFVEEFPKSVEQQVRKSGTMLTYIPVSEVITRLNRVVGVENWEQEIVFVGRDSHDPDYVTAHVRIKLNLPDGRVVLRDGVGGQKIKRTKAGDIVDLGDEYKGAVSDAFKKACQTLGIGLYLARSEEALAADEGAQVREPDPTSIQLFATLREITSQLDSDKKKKLREFWGSSFGDLQVGVEAGAEALTAAINKALSLSGSSDTNNIDEAALIAAFPGSEVVDE